METQTTDFILTRLGGLTDLTLYLQVSSVVKVGAKGDEIFGIRACWSLICECGIFWSYSLFGVIAKCFLTLRLLQKRI